MKGAFRGTDVPQAEEDWPHLPELHEEWPLFVEHQDRPLVLELAGPRAPRRPARAAVLETEQVVSPIRTLPAILRVGWW
jgi:hypothetical protein